MPNNIDFLAVCSSARSATQRGRDEARILNTFSELVQCLQQRNNAELSTNSSCSAPAINYDPLRLMNRSDAKLAPPKRYFRAFWRTAARRLLERPHAWPIPDVKMTEPRILVFPGVEWKSWEVYYASACCSFQRLLFVFACSLVQRWPVLGAFCIIERQDGDGCVSAQTAQRRNCSGEAAAQPPRATSKEYTWRETRE